MKTMRLKYWCLLVLSVLLAGACSDGELEGDLYPVSPDQGGNGGNGNNSKVIEGLMESMERIPGGTFLMGSEQSAAETDESPAHLVKLDAFYISKYEVTQRLWKEIMGNNPSTVKWQSYYPNGYIPSYYEDYPVTNVSYNDCLEFIRKLNEKTGKKFALPTEAQWELAARGYYAMKEYNGDSSESYNDDYSVPMFYYADNSNMTLHEVYSLSSNQFGLYQMSGNVYEWVADWYGAYSAGMQENPKGPSSGTYRVFRGGSCASSEDECRVTARASNYPSTKGDDLGFRLVMNGLMDLQVSASKLDFTRNGGQKTLTVTSENNWSYRSSASWCRLSKSGDELTVVVESHNGKARTAKITITAGEDEIEIPVSQAGETFELLYNNEAVDTLKATHLGGMARLTVQAPSSSGWSVSSYDNSWCHVTRSGSSVELIIDQNYNEYAGRETYILLRAMGNYNMTDTLWVVQKRVITLSLKMDGDPVKYLSAQKNSAYADIKVQTNAEGWKAVSDAPDWCRLSEIYDGFRINIDAIPYGVKKRETFVAVDAEGITDTIWIRQGRVQVGDVYDRNGVKGIVYEVSSDEQSGKIVSLMEGSYIWSSRYTSSNGQTNAISTVDGEANMRTILNTGYSISNWPAFQWCYGYSYDNQWYLPAVNELAEMFAAIRNYGTSKFDRILSENGGQEFSSASDYWSSTERNFEWAYTVNKSGTGRSNVVKNNNYRVRAIRKVTFD